jgi:acetyl esterase/lipase
VEQTDVKLKLQSMWIIVLALILHGCDSDSDNQSSADPGGQTLPAIADAEMVEYQRLAYGNQSYQYGDLRLPLHVASPYPVAVIIHGGCWQRNQLLGTFTIDSTTQMAKALADAGIASWNIEFRTIDDISGGWPNTFLDVGKAIDSLEVLATVVPIDLNKVVVSGHSAGGHLALWSAGRAGLDAGSLLKTADPLTIKGVLSLAGISDLEVDMACQQNVDNLVGLANFGNDPASQARLAETSPIAMLPTTVRTKLAAGVFDGVVPAAEAQDYVAAAVLAGDDSEFISLPASGHFNLIQPNAPDWALILSLYEDLLNN